MVTQADSLATRYKGTKQHFFALTIMSSPIYYHPNGSPYAAAAIPLPPSPYGSPYTSPFASPYGTPHGSPYGPAYVALPPSPYRVPVALPHTPIHNPLPLPPSPSPLIATASSFNAHHLLALNAEDPAIAWDVRLPPDTIRISNPPFPPVTSYYRDQHAVSPPWTFVRLRSTLLQWIVECTNPEGVTVGNVLDAIYDCLRAKVTKDEWLDASKEFQGRLLDSWERRCIMTGTDEGRAARVREERKGIRRVDWLLWDFEWLGITRSETELETWDIHFRSR